MIEFYVNGDRLYYHMAEIPIIFSNITVFFT